MNAARHLHSLHGRNKRTAAFLFLGVFALQCLIAKWRTENASDTEEIYRSFIRNITSRAADHNDYRVVYDHADVTRRDVTNYDVTLVTQCSLNNLHHVLETMERWDGPVSLGLFSPGFEALHAAIAARLIRHCYQDRDLKMHLVYPMESPPTYNSGNNDELEIWAKYFDAGNKAGCTNLPLTLRSFKGRNYAAGRFPYPHNTLRNVAKKAVVTSHHLLLDVDVMPSPGIRKKFAEYARSEDKATGKAAFVVPAFEADSSRDIPTSKKELRKFFNLEKVRPFHAKTCPACHRPTSYADWFAVSDDVTIAFQVDWEASWEPFYISTNDVPAHDERFKQYGYDRISQVCEMNMAGYEFHILSYAFVVHKGLKEPSHFHAEKDAENKRNFQLYENDFRRDLSIKYPNVTWSCSGGKSKREGKAKVSFQGHMKVHQMRFKKTKEMDREL